MRSRTFGGGLASLLMCVVAQGTPWEVDFEGNTLPEQQYPPWYRVWNPPGDTRTIQADPEEPGNNWLTIDSRADPEMYDWGECDHPIHVNGLTERFWSEWRVCIVQQTGLEGDQGIDIVTDYARAIALTFGYNHLYCWDDGWTYPIAPGAFHTYRIESADLLTYWLWIDGAIIRNAAFSYGTPGPYVDFGDVVSGGGIRSLCEWDYIRFGVTQVPEPAALGLLAALCAVGGRGRR